MDFQSIVVYFYQGIRKKKIMQKAIQTFIFQINL